MKEPFIIGIAGGSGSGKTTVIDQLRMDLPKVHVSILNQRMYSKQEEERKDEGISQNEEHPLWYDLDALSRDLEALRRGETIERKSLDASSMVEETWTIEPKEVILVEGNHILSSEHIRSLLDLKVFIDTSSDVRLIRLILREIQKGSHIESLLLEYMTRGRKNHEAFVEPTKKFADLILPEGGKNVMALDVLSSAIKQRLENIYDEDLEKCE
ncbi:MAG: uridine kinase [Tissierellia bacterium]|nr:uridine kinase [Tissierellia bacterium]